MIPLSNIVLARFLAPIPGLSRCIRALSLSSQSQSFRMFVRSARAQNTVLSFTIQYVERSMRTTVAIVIQDVLSQL